MSAFFIGFFMVGMVDADSHWARRICALGAAVSIAVGIAS